MLILSQANGIAVSIFLGVMCAVFIINIFFSITLVRPWIRAMLGGKPMPLVQIVGMQFRKTNANLIIDQGIAATQSGHPIEWVELERAYLKGVDLEKVVLAYVTAKKRGDNFSFEEIVDAAQESRLSQMLQREQESNGTAPLEV